jgi:tRNA(adenine34) deaminase
MSPVESRRHRFDRALASALAQAAQTDEDVPVGAVVLDADGNPVAEAANEREARGDPTAHAEILALRRAAAALGDRNLEGCTLAVTLEPCAMCAGAAVLARIEVLVYGARDPKAGAAGSLWDIVRDPRLNHQIEVVPPDLVDPATARRCSELLIEFFARRRLR